MRTLNLGILAHVDAGKTTLTERLLYHAGVIGRIGSVDDGSTHTDFLPLERQRGITIKSAVVNFTIGDVSVNLIDTPGHPDFIAEVERVLNVLDGAVLLLSAVEGVQAQTRILFRTLQRLRIPTLIFVSKIDRMGACPEVAVEAVKGRLTPNVRVMGSVRQEGSAAAAYLPFTASDTPFVDAAVDLIAAQDEDFVTAYANGPALSAADLRPKVAQLTRELNAHPLFFGSAVTGAGVDDLANGIEEFLPTGHDDPSPALSAAVFKVERGPLGDKVALARIFSGTVRVRDHISFGESQGGKVTGLRVFEQGRLSPAPYASAGQITKIWGLGNIRIGDRLGQRGSRSETQLFARPMLESAVVPRAGFQKHDLHLALTQLAEQDPLIDLRQDDVTQELYVSMYGEVQKEVIQATPELEFGMQAEFRAATPICVERPTRTGEAVERLGRGSPFAATIGLRVDPAPSGSGVEFVMGVGIRSTPMYIFRSIDEFEEAMTETVNKALHQGLHGWHVVDCRVTLTESDFLRPIGSAPSDFRLLTPLVLMEALRKSDVVVCEPVSRFDMEIPAESLATVTSILGRLNAVLEASDWDGAVYRLGGHVRSADVYQLQRMLPPASRGEGTLETEMDGYEPVLREPVPTRPRTDLNPKNRKEYLLRLSGRL